MASRISCSSGCGLRSSRARAVSIIPGVQKPHCSPCSSMKPCCTGSSVPPSARPSTVRTSCPAVIAASWVQDFTGSPSTSTTQVPQLLVSHPQWVPVRPSVSRRKCTSSSRGSTSRATSVPLTVIVTCMSASLSGGGGVGGAVEGPREGAPGELLGQVALVVHGAALVLDRCAGRARQVRGLREEVLAGPLPDEDGGRVGRQPLEPEGRQPDRGVGDGAVLGHPERGARGADRPVPDPPLDLLVGVAAAGPDRKPDLGEQFVLLAGGLVGAAVEL